MMIKLFTHGQKKIVKKNPQFIPSIIFALLLFPFTAAASSFSDVSTNNLNAPAIQFLKNQGIISGYPDGTFHPDQAVTRVEFLKLLFQTAGITLDVTAPTKFKDVDENAWYAPYVRKAKQAGWIEGYADNTFQPDQPVNKVEGLKMIAAVTGWQIVPALQNPFKDTSATDWFTPDVAYAKSHGYLEESGSFFIPSASLSRAKTSEMLFRILITKQTGATSYTADLINKIGANPSGILETAPQAPDPSAVPYGTIPQNYFDNLNLDQDFPNTFYANEIYAFNGKTNDPKYDTAFAFLKGTNIESFDNSLATNTNRTFSIPVIFRKPGNYLLGIVASDTNQSKVVAISVLPNLPSPTSTVSSSTPTNLSIKYLNQKTTVSWENGNDNLAQIIFTEGSIHKTFFTRQNLKNLDLIYNEFQDFQPGQISLQIASAKTSQVMPLTIDTAWTESSSTTFIATTHDFSDVRANLITDTILPEIMSTPGTITISGKALTDIFEEANIIRPDGKIDSLNLTTSASTSTYLDENVIPAGSDYSFNYTATGIGTYILEINGKDGQAVINTPVYIQNGVPLLPDFFDLESSGDTSDENTDHATLINNLLTLTNQDRTKAGLNSLNLDPQLNQLAQNYADDLVKRNFFSHVNPEGETPDDRRIKLGITTAVGENIAAAPNLLFAHESLMRSAIHQENLLDPDWERVGLGVTKTSDNYLMVVEEFSTNPIDATKLESIKTGMGNTINQERQSNQTTALSEDSTLESLAQNWSNEMVQEKFFDFAGPNGDSLQLNIQKNITDKNVQIYVLQSGSLNLLNQKIAASTQALDFNWKNFGLGLQIDPNGILDCTLLLSDDGH